MKSAAMGSFEVWMQELREAIKDKKGLSLQDCETLLRLDGGAWFSAWEDGDTPKEALDNELDEWARRT